MRRSYVGAATVMLAAAPAHAEGYSGYFRVAVTDGGYTLRDFDADTVTRVNLVGETFVLKWTSLIELNAPSPSSPSQTVARLVTNRASIDTGGFTFGSFASNDPFFDTGSAFIGANYRGNATAASFGVVYNCNDCPDSSVSFSFDQTSGRALGSGIAYADDDGQNTYTGEIKFDIIGGAAFASVPEPASWAMMIAGFGLLGSAARRRRFAFSSRALA